LQARRNSLPPSVAIPWLPLVSGGVAATVLAAFFVLGNDEVRMQFNGARLMGERSQGIGLQMLDNRRTTAVPSGDPNVRFYWIEPNEPSAH
jgi:hypothetical protein